MNTERIEYLLKERRAIVEEQDLMKSALDEVNNELLDLLGNDSFETDQEKAIVVRQGNKTVYDWDKLRESVSDEVWNRITTRVPNQDMFEKAVQDGLIPLSTVSEASNTKPGAKPYVKISKKR